jgi:hypothetical protein
MRNVTKLRSGEVTMSRASVIFIEFAFEELVSQGLIANDLKGRCDTG